MERALEQFGRIEELESLQNQAFGAFERQRVRYDDERRQREDNRQQVEHEVSEVLTKYGRSTTAGTASMIDDTDSMMSRFS